MNGQPGTGPAQVGFLNSLKQDIIFKDEDSFSTCCQPFSHTKEMRFIDSLFRVILMFLYDDKFNPVQQANSVKLLPCCLPSVLPLINGDTVNRIKKIPTVSVIHGCLSEKKC